jgi:hypothetical protein
MKQESLRSQLMALELRAKIAERTGPGSFWVGDVAGERRVSDDGKSGRLALRQVHLHSKNGLQYLNDGDSEMAEAYLTEAVWLYIAVLEQRIRPDDWKILAKPAKKRGRPQKIK